MPNSRPPYPPEVRGQMNELVGSDRKPEELSREFEPTAQKIHNWVRQRDRDEGRRDDRRNERLAQRASPVAAGEPAALPPWVWDCAARSTGQFGVGNHLVYLGQKLRLAGAFVMLFARASNKARLVHALNP